MLRTSRYNVDVVPAQAKLRYAIVLMNLAIFISVVRLIVDRCLLAA